MDVNTGNVLAGHNERLRLPPASLTKVLTALIAVTYLPAGTGIPGTAVSESAYPNQVGIERGVAWPLGEVLQSLLVYSANDAAYAIAQRISGSLAAFGRVMQRSARQIGMSDSPVFHDPAGLDGTEGVGGGNMVSARDLAIAGRDLLEVPELAGMVKEQSYDFVDPTGKARDLPSWNYTFLANYPGAVGIKTGFTDLAGACIMAAATRHGRTMLAVVMNAYNETASATELLDQGFATPARAERKADHLPPFSLPSSAPPPTKATPHAKAGRRARAREARQAPGLDRTPARPSAHPAGGEPSPGPRPGAGPGEKGLASVIRTWPAKVLLALAAFASVLALWEFVGTNRVRRGRQGSPVGPAPGNRLVAGFSPSRRRHQRLLASYQRHERH